MYIRTHFQECPKTLCCERLRAIARDFGESIERNLDKSAVFHRGGEEKGILCHFLDAHPYVFVTCFQCSIISCSIRYVYLCGEMHLQLIAESVVGGPCAVAGQFRPPLVKYLLVVHTAKRYLENALLCCATLEPQYRRVHMCVHNSHLHLHRAHPFCIAPIHFAPRKSNYNVEFPADAVRIPTTRTSTKLPSHKKPPSYLPLSLTAQLYPRLSNL